MSKTIDVEQFLQWVVNDELLKGCPEDQTAYAGIVAHVEKVRAGHRGHNRSHYAPRSSLARGDFRSRGYVSGEPHPDAIVAAKIWSKFDRVAGMPDNQSILRMLGPLVNIEVPDHKGRLPCVTAANAITPNLAYLLVICAVLKRPPVCDLRHPRPLKTRRRNGKPLALREDADGNLIEAYVKNWRPSECVGSPRSPLEWSEPRLEKIAEQRAEYTIWWSALAELANQLRGRLRDHNVTPPGRSATPWLDGYRDQESAPRQPVLFKENGAGSILLPGRA
jgi:hypothetical protein